jgi:uncharacterized protein (TIGR03437 family)
MGAPRKLSAISLLFTVFLLPIGAATLGTVIPITGGVSDLTLDDNRNVLYLVRSLPYDRIDIFSTTQRRVLSSVPTDRNPLAAAMSRDGNFLYVVCYDAASLNIVDLRANPPAVVRKISLPARPEAVAVGADERVLITTIGSGANNLLNTLLLFDPNADQSRALSTVPVTPPPPLPPTFPPLAGRVALAARSELTSTPDGQWIIGVNNVNATTGTVFVYQASSGSVLRSRIIGNTATTLSVAPDGSRFMVGLRLFDMATLAVLGQQNAANARFPLSTNITAQGFAQVGNQFNLQQNQGGSVFARDGSVVYTSFNIAPIQNPPARANVTQLFLNDPENLFIHDSIQLPENLSSELVISRDGSTIYGSSESGFTIIPVADITRSPIVQPASTVALLARDQCNSTPEGSVFRVSVVNETRTPTPITATATLINQLGGVAVPGLGGGPGGGPGGGAPGGGVIIIPPIPIPGQPVQPGLNPGQNALLQTAPVLRTVREGANTFFEFGFNANAARSLGTAPSNDYVITSPQAVNTPARVRVFQNARNTEARGDLRPVETAVSPNEGLTDMVMDPVRNRLYISNSGMNRVEVFDIRTKQFLAPIKVGQLPRSLALTPEGSLLYVANSGAETISIVDPERMVQTGYVKFPPIPFNGNVPVLSPTVIAATQRGLQIIMSNGSLWRVIGDEAVPRPASQLVGAATLPAPRTAAATPNGEFMIVLAGNGNAYLYDAMVDDFVAARQVAPAPITGYFGPITAGPRGQYFVVNNLVLNQSLSPISGTGGGGVVPDRGETAPPTRPVAAVYGGAGTMFARYSQPVRANANAVVTDTPAIELLNPNTGGLMRSVPALEGPVSVVTGNQRANVDGRTMAVDAALENAYVLSTSGLSVIPLDVVPVTQRPVFTAAGVVNVGTYTGTMAPNSLVSIFGTNLADSSTASTTPLPTLLGGVCATLNNVPLPLLMTSTGQINAQVPPELAAGRYPLIIRSFSRKIASTTQQVTVSRYAPAVLVEPETRRALLYRPNGQMVTTRNPAKRDEPLVMYAVGLGLPKAPVRITSGNPAPTTTLAETDTLKVFFKKVDSAADITRGFRAQEEVIVDWSGLVPGFVGLYQINLRVPGFHEKGQDLQVVLRIGGVDSPLTGPVVPLVAVD